MIDATTGWAIGANADDAHRTLRTLDGGETWSDVTPPETGPHTENYQASFLDASQAWVLYWQIGIVEPGPATVWHTQDGGQSWVGSLFPTSFDAYQEPFEMTFADGQNGWLIAGGVAAGGVRLSLYQTQNGGADWTPWGGGEDLCGESTELAFADAQNGWWTGTCPEPLQATRDGGTTWEWVVLAAPPDLQEGEVVNSCEASHPALFTPEIGVVKLTCWHEGQERHYVYRTRDGGQSWDFHSMPGGAMQFITPEVGFSLDREIHKTTDGGETWEHVKTVSWDGQFSFVDELHGWAVARSDGALAFIRTVNGGRSWQELQPLAR